MTAQLVPLPALAPAPAERPHLQRHPAVGHRPPRQRPRGDPQLRHAPVGIRGDLLHRRLPRPDEQPRSGPAAPADGRDGGVAPRARPRPGPLHAVRPEPPAGAHGAGLAPVHRHAGQLARADPDVQGEEGQPARRHQPRAAHLPGPPGGRHRHLQGVARAGRQGPGRPSRARRARSSAPSTPATATRSRSPRPCSPRRPWSSAPMASGR